MLSQEEKGVRFECLKIAGGDTDQAHGMVDFVLGRDDQGMRFDLVFSVICAAIRRVDAYTAHGIDDRDVIVDVREKTVANDVRQAFLTIWPDVEHIGPHAQRSDPNGYA